MSRRSGICARVSNFLDLNRLMKLNLNHLSQIRFYVKSRYLESRFNRLYKNKKYLSPNAAKKWKTLLQSDTQKQPDVQSSEKYENSDFLPNQDETFPNQQSSENDEESGTMMRHTHSGKLYFLAVQ